MVKRDDSVEGETEVCSQCWGIGDCHYCSGYGYLPHGHSLREKEKMFENRIERRENAQAAMDLAVKAAERMLKKRKKNVRE